MLQTTSSADSGMTVKEGFSNSLFFCRINLVLKRLLPLWDNAMVKDIRRA